MRNAYDQSRRDLLSMLGLTTLSSLLPVASPGSASESLYGYPDDIPHTVAGHPWPVEFGNHRAHIYVKRRAEAVGVSIPWRRVDVEPEKKAILITNAEGTPINNASTLRVLPEAGAILFEAKEEGDYFVYYLPHAIPKNDTELKKQIGTYQVPKQTGDAPWRRRFAASVFSYPSAQWDSLPKATVTEFQARTAHDSFWPMEVAATDAEVKLLCRAFPQPVLIFVEDREHPIKMLDNIPHRWIQRGPDHKVKAEAFRGECYVFQLAFYGNPQALSASVVVSGAFAELRGEESTISASSWWISRRAANPREISVKVSPGALQVLWCGVQVPLEANSGVYRGQIELCIGENEPATIEVEMEVNQQFLRAGGDDEPWRLSRLRWLDSSIGEEETVTAPYTPVQVQGQTITVLGRVFEVGDKGLPVSVKANGEELLTSPVSLNIYKQSKLVEWRGTCKVGASTPARASCSSEGYGDGYDLWVQSTIEFDGAMLCEVELSGRYDQTISDIVLEVPYVRERVPYAVGMNLRGGERPKDWIWTWSEQPAAWKEQGIDVSFFCWLGSVDSGLYCRLKPPLDEWQNNDRGSVRIREAQNEVLLRVSCGPRTLKAGEPVRLNFLLLPTPVKPVNKDHWRYRYAHAYESATEAETQAATVINVHHGMLPNRYINYPFLNQDLLVPYVESAHVLGIKVKLYYTMRELTTWLPELWAFRSLGNEIYVGPGVRGEGDQAVNFWVQEHIRINYSSGWVQPLPFGEIDTSLRVDSKSRLANAYLEGLRWLVEVTKIDGIYLDEIGYGRKTMQRVRRVLDQRTGTMIDMHANHLVWSCECPIGYYMEHLPYINRLWLGEAFDPDSSPEFWLIEMSGLPFGLSSDMLERPNPWRGMLFGMTSRAHYAGSQGADPTPIWRLWESFGIEDAKMLGWWDERRLVNTNRKDVLATAYQLDRKCLIVIASWAKSTVSVRLQIDWRLMGFEKVQAKITAPKLEGLQDAVTFAPDSPIPLKPGGGWMLLVATGDSPALQGG